MHGHKRLKEDLESVVGKEELNESSEGKEDAIATTFQPATRREILQCIMESYKFQVAVITLVIFDSLLVISELLIDLEIIVILKSDSFLVPDIIHYTSLTILSLFLVEIALKMYVYQLAFFTLKLEVFDAIVVIVSYILDIIFRHQHDSTDGIGLLIMLRLWRVARVLNGIVLSVKKESEHRFVKEREHRRAIEEELRKYREVCAAQEGEIEALRQCLEKHNIPGIEVPCSRKKNGMMMDVVAEVNQSNETQKRWGGNREGLGGSKEKSGHPLDGMAHEIQLQLDIPQVLPHSDLPVLALATVIDPYTDFQETGNVRKMEGFFLSGGQDEPNMGQSKNVKNTGPPMNGQPDVIAAAVRTHQDTPGSANTSMGRPKPQRRQSLPENEVIVYPELHLYPSDRILVTSERRSYVGKQQRFGQTFRRPRRHQVSSSSLSSVDVLELPQTNGSLSESFETQSDISGYEEEIAQIKHLADELNIPLSPASISGPEEEIRHLTKQLQLIKDERDRLQKELTQTGNSPEFLKALKDKAAVEGRLEVIMRELDSVSSERANLHARLLDTKWELESAQGSLAKIKLGRGEEQKELNASFMREREAREKLAAIQSALDSKEAELEHWHLQYYEKEKQIEEMATANRALRDERDAKEATIRNLKEKLMQMRCQWQSAVQEQSDVKNDLKRLRSELESSEKTQAWYAEKLEELQGNRSRVQYEALRQQSCALAHATEVEQMRSQLKRLELELQETKERGIQEKEAVMRELEEIQAEMCEREHLLEILTNRSSVDDEVKNRLRQLEEERVHKSILDQKVRELEGSLKLIQKTVAVREEQLLSSESTKTAQAQRICDLEEETSVQLLNLDTMRKEMEKVRLENRQNAELASSRNLALQDALAAQSKLELALMESQQEYQDLEISLKITKEQLSSKDTLIRDLESQLALRVANIAELEHANEQGKDDLRCCKGRQHELQDLMRLLEQRIHDRDVTIKQLRTELSNIEDELRHAHEQLEALNEVKAKSVLDQEKLKDQDRAIERLSTELQAVKKSPGMAQVKTRYDDDIAALKTSHDLLKAKYKILRERMSSASPTVHSAPASPIPPVMCVVGVQTEVRDETYLRYETHVRFLVRKIGEHLRARKRAEQELKEERLKMDEERRAILDDFKLDDKQLALEVETLRAKLRAMEESQENAKVHAQNLEAQVEKLSKRNSDALERQDCDATDQSESVIKELHAALTKEQEASRALKRQVFVEKREISRLRTEIGSLKLGLETANKQLDVQAKQLQQQELQLKDAEDKKSWAELELEREKGIEQELQRELESHKHQLQQALLKDPLLADQIRTLSHTAHERAQELAALKESWKLVEERHQEEKAALEKIVLELRSAKQTMDAERLEFMTDNSTLSQQIQELQNALACALRQNQEYEGVLGSLPEPRPMDEESIQAVLDRVKGLKRGGGGSKPLQQLQACLLHLRQERDALLQHTHL
ncbi:unnamed protein product [Darwinula stevensoni]|uniref:Voltage-gated hydrogen channel 1 n=1 Tax=Darwinula stevensoni TaxID=69355 RepID=A0A7R8X7A5_9CRUS|nr:unnamed protein product [Darwinula stevensoni]CAG0882112.1 unnamed protein product [Darwinula stevensoni]